MTIFERYGTTYSVQAGAPPLGAHWGNRPCYWLMVATAAHPPQVTSSFSGSYFERENAQAEADRLNAWARVTPAPES